VIGLALLAADWDVSDIDLIRHIGLLSEKFGPLAARALKRRSGGSEALLWSVLQREDWSSMARAALDPTDKSTAWFLETIAPRLRLLS
jgi:hypothetical protein